MRIPRRSIPHGFLLLLPLLFANVASSEEPSRWEEDMAAFREREAKSPSPEGSILFVGSSTVRLWDLKASWPDALMVNNGFGGSTLADALRHFDTLIEPYQPGAVVIYSGDNDMSKGRGIEGTTADFKTLAERVRKTHPGIPVLILAIKPSVKRWNLWPEMKQVNEAVAAFCASGKGFHFVDIATPMLGEGGAMPDPSWFREDGLHLSAKGYAEWTRIVGDALRECGALKG